MAIVRILSTLIFSIILLLCVEKEPLITEEVLVNKNVKFADEVQVYKIKYLSDDLEIGGYLVKPKKIDKKLPVIVYNRGGNRNYALINNKRINYLEYLASNGYIVLASQYRGNIYSEGIDEMGGNDVNDVLKLIEIAKDLPDGDKKNIFMLGFSRGGAMTYIADKKGADVNAIAVIAGVTDFFESYERDEGMKNLYKNIIGGSPEALPGEYKKRSVVYWADKIKSPLIIFHGEQDTRVNIEQSEKLVEELKKYEKEYKFIRYKDVGHGMDQHWDEVNQIIFEWFEKYKK